MPIDTDAVAVPAEPTSVTPQATVPNEQENAAAVESALSTDSPPAAVVHSVMPMGVDIEEKPGD